MRVGEAELRLASGPVWHYRYIRRLAPAVILYMAEEIGAEETVRRFGDPLWFQTFSSLMGFEWQFSGATTVTLKALMEGLPRDSPIKVVAGKGKVEVPSEWRERSKRALKFDSVAFQDGYSIYFHGIVYTEDLATIINQGMNIEERMARRYHWLEDERVQGRRGRAALVFNHKNEELKEAIVDIVQDMPPNKISYTVITLSKMAPGQTTLFGERIELPYYLKIPRKINERALYIAKEVENFQQLLMVDGIGANTLRGLAYIANIIYGVPISWEDPVLYTYGFGTKVGIPYLVDTWAMEEVSNFLDRARLEDREKRFLLKRLYRLMKYVSEREHKGSVRCAYTSRENKA